MDHRVLKDKIVIDNVVLHGAPGLDNVCVSWRIGS